jgi:hypothetical protein
MNPNDYQPTDPLAQRLSKEAQLEQPSFSPQLHYQILQRIQSDGSAIDPSRSRWFTFAQAAAAVVLITSIWFVSWMLRSHHRSIQPQPISISKQSELPGSLVSATLTVEIPGVLSANLWPPEIRFWPYIPRLDSLSADQLQPQPVSSIPSPQWLIARLQAPSTSANEILADLAPPELRDVLDLFAQTNERRE